MVAYQTKQTNHTNEDNSQMAILQSNYKTFLQQDTIDRIDSYVEDGYNIDQMLQFIDDYSEQDFLFYYEDYQNAVDNLDSDIVDAFIDINGISEVSSACDAYVGWYQSTGDFAESYINSITDVPDMIVVDWDATWDRTLMYDFDDAPANKYGVHIFNRNY